MATPDSQGPAVPGRLSLKELERKAYRLFFRDGLWDLYLGLLLLTMGIPVLLTRPGASESALPIAVGLGMALVAVGVFFGGKRYVTVPRLGTATFGAARRTGRRRTALVLTFSVLVGLALFVLSGLGIGTRGGLAGIPVPALAWAGNCLIVFGLGAYFLDFGRLYAYGVLYAASFPLAVVLRTQAGLAQGWLIAYALTSAPMLIIGLVLFVRFLHDYPPPPKEAPDGERA
jgi:hypothetical protein